MDTLRCNPNGFDVDTTTFTDLRFSLLNDWQRDFPLVAEPFAAIGTACHATPDAVLGQYRELLRGRAISRIGGVWGAGVGGAGMLCALAVPKHRLEAVAALVSAHPGVNHNYEREHEINLWFVITGRDLESITQAVDDIEQQTGLSVLRLRMKRAYRIDLGFDLRAELAVAGQAHPAHAAPVDVADAPLAALLEDGLPLLHRAFDAWSQALKQPREAVLGTLQRWLRSGTLRRFGVVVRHHEAGFAHNAMTVFDVPDALVDECGAALASQRGVTLAYRRERADGWPYNLYCMVHGRDRGAVRSAIDIAVARCRLYEHPREVLFSTRRFKQTGARYFGARPESVPHANA